MTEDVLTEQIAAADPLRDRVVAVPTTAALMTAVNTAVIDDPDFPLLPMVSGPVAAPARTRGWGATAIAVAVFVVVLVGIQLAPIGKPPVAHAAITLAAFDEQLPVPWVLTDPPAGVANVDFSGGLTGVDAVYLDTTGTLPAGDIYVITGPNRPVETVQYPVEEVAVAGTTGYLDSALSQADLPRLEVSWRAVDGQWVTVAGNGGRANKMDVLDLAAHVRRGEPVTSFNVTVAPKGWHLSAFKGADILTLTPDAQPSGQDDSITITYSPQADATFPAGYPPGRLTDVTSNGRPGHLLELASDSGWVVDLELPTSGTLRIIAGAELTREQILRIAEGVELTRQP